MVAVTASVAAAASSIAIDVSAGFSVASTTTASVVVAVAATASAVAFDAAANFAVANQALLKPDPP